MKGDATMNKCIFMGRLTDDVKISGEGEKIRGNFRIAINSYSKDKQQTATFINCVAFGKQVEFINKYFHKGNPIIVESHVSVSNYEKDGVSHTYTSFIVERVEFVVGSKNDSSSGSASQTSAPAPAPASTPTSATSDDGFMNVDDGDLPWA